MKKWLKYTIATVGCLAVIFPVVCLIINFRSENEKSHYGTVHRSKAAEQKKEGITQYFISLRGLDENSEYSYYSEGELAEAGQDFCDDYSVWFPQGIEDTGKGKTVVNAIRKDIERWKKREPSFQGCEVIKEKHTLHETLVQVEIGTPVNGIMYVVYQKAFYHGSSEEIDYTLDVYISEYTEVQIKNYDINTGQEVKLADLFYEDTDYVAWLEDYLFKTGQFHTEDQENGTLATRINEDTEFFLYDGQLCIPSQSRKPRGFDDYFVNAYIVSGTDMMESSALGSYHDNSKYAVTGCLCGDVKPQITIYEHKTDAEKGSREINAGKGKTEEYQLIWNCPISKEIKQSIRERYSEPALYMNENDYIEIENESDKQGLPFTVKTKHTLGRVGNLYVMTTGQGIDFDDEFREARYDVMDMVSEDAREILWYGAKQIKCFDTEGKPVTVWDLFKDPEEAHAVVAELAFKVQKEEGAEENFSEEEWKKIVKTAEIKPTYSGLKILDKYTIPWDDLIPYLK